MVEEFLADATPNYQAASAHMWRAVIRLARGDAEGASEDARTVVELARSARDPQLALTTSAVAAATLLAIGDEGRALETFDETLTRYRELPELGFAAQTGHERSVGRKQHGRQVHPA